MIQSNATRTNTVAVVMGIVLLLSLGAAFLTTGLRRTKVDQLVLAIPKYWKQSPEPTPGWLNESAAYRAGHDDSTALLVGSLRSHSRRSPQTALRQVLGALRVDQAHDAHTVRIQNLDGQLCTWGRYVLGTNVLNLNMLAILTDNGRHYWMIYLRKRIVGPIDPRDPPYPRRLFHRILVTARSERVRNVTEAELRVEGFMLAFSNGSRTLIRINADRFVPEAEGHIRHNDLRIHCRELMGNKPFTIRRVRQDKFLTKARANHIAHHCFG